MPGGENWLTRPASRIDKGWLGHIAMVPEPAYEGARVLAVRQKASGAAGREQVADSEPRPFRAWRLQEEFDRLSRYTAELQSSRSYLRWWTWVGPGVAGDSAPGRRHYHFVDRRFPAMRPTDQMLAASRRDRRETSRSSTASSRPPRRKAAT